MTVFLHVLINHRWMSLPVRLLRSQHSVSPSEQVQCSRVQLQLTLQTFEVWWLINVFLPLGFPKRLNTLGDPRHPVYLPAEHGFEVQKVTIKVTDEGDAQDQETWPLKEHLGKNRCPRNREGGVLPVREGRSSGRGGSRFDGVWSSCHLGESSQK